LYRVAQKFYARRRMFFGVQVKNTTLMKGTPSNS
jgi:hypothetical protein